MIGLWRWFSSQLMERWFLWTLFWINLLGSIYGYYWYLNQLKLTPAKYLIFVPDSPTASAAFTLVLFCYLMGRRSPLIEAFAAITLIKYGVWAVVMIFWGASLQPEPLLDAVVPAQWMLTFSHLGMAFQAFLYAKYFSFGWKEIAIVSVWTFLNDAIDYLADMHPWVGYYLEPYDHLVGYFTVLLSVTSILVVTMLSWRKSTDRLTNLPKVLG
ncbi:DUF1405 domain-containing protein [Risungbinella massiliensis]|uniref:DUF1405 domain-containing protein n=1 Tax=Risungbinella massiliensis TaxID=1329796 RepID=UPI0005CC6FC7|nr:DUF1405 domain-containing protein [Risungbinella massiliensis]